MPDLETLAPYESITTWIGSEEMPEPLKVKLLDEFHIANELGIDRYKLSKWIKDESIETPPVRYEVHGRQYWGEEDLPAFQAIWDEFIRNAYAVDVSMFTLTSKLRDQAKRVKAHAERAGQGGYNRRDYPKGEAREKVIGLQAVRKFIHELTDVGIQPISVRKEINENIQSARNYLGMDK